MTEPEYCCDAEGKSGIWIWTGGTYLPATSQKSNDQTSYPCPPYLLLDLSTARAKFQRFPRWITFELLQSRTSDLGSLRIVTRRLRTTDFGHHFFRIVQVQTMQLLDHQLFVPQTQIDWSPKQRDRENCKILRNKQNPIPCQHPCPIMSFGLPW